MQASVKSVYIAWQDPDSRSWHTVGKLSSNNDEYEFNYTNGAKSNNFIPFTGMTDLGSTYRSRLLFPLFSKRLLSDRRPEFNTFMSWLGLDKYQNNKPIMILAKSGGMKRTDSLQFFPEIKKDENNQFELEFFVHGIKYLTASARERVKNLHTGDKLYLMPDPQNPVDRYALAVRVSEPTEIVGYCPRFLSKDLGDLLMDDESMVDAHVAKANPEAPFQYQLMCKLVGTSVGNAEILSGTEFQLLSKS